MPLHNVTFNYYALPMKWANQHSFLATSPTCVEARSANDLRTVIRKPPLITLPLPVFLFYGRASLESSWSHIGTAVISNQGILVMRGRNYTQQPGVSLSDGSMQRAINDFWDMWVEPDRALSSYLNGDSSHIVYFVPAPRLSVNYSSVTSNTRILEFHGQT